MQLRYRLKRSITHEPPLAQLQRHAAHPHTPADLRVYRIGLFLGHDLLLQSCEQRLLASTRLSADQFGMRSQQLRLDARSLTLGLQRCANII